MRVILPNFSFDDRLLRRGGGRRQPALQRVMDSLAPLTALAGDPGDVVLVSASAVPAQTPHPLSHVKFIADDRIEELAGEGSTGISVTPWGWDADARRLAAALGSAQAIPAEPAVRAVNHRRFLADFDTTNDDSKCDWFDGKFGQLCDDLNQLQAGIDQLARHGISCWVVKPAYSAAGRNRVCGQSRVLDRNQRGWLRNQLQLGECVYLEPWLPVIRECGVQLKIAAAASDSADVELTGVAELVTDRSGRYLGSLISDPAAVDDVWREAIDHAGIIARQAAGLGYFGPLGVDCMQVRLPDGRRLLRRCHDINGRLTMGRLALQLRSQLDDAQSAVWLHSSVSDRALEPRSGGKHPAFTASDIVDVIEVSPVRIGGHPPAVRSWLYVTSDQRAAKNLLQSIRQHIHVQTGGGH